MTDRTIVVVGASLAGFRAAEELRTHGFDGRLVVVGEEPHRPYDRPPLSKAVLAGRREPGDIGLSPPDPAVDLAVEWELGVRASGLDVADRCLTLGDGRTITYDGCVVATGAVPRRLAGWGERRGLHVLRTLDDCLALRADLDAAPDRVVVVGAGFIGAEVAATARGRGLDVTLIEPLPAPVVRGLGERMGGFVADVHRDHGVDVRLGVGVGSLAGDEREVAGVRLSDGTSIVADVVVVGVGVRPATDWLDGSGLTLDDGVVCDAACLAAPGVVAAGDLARWPLDGPGTPSVRIEHWDNAVGQGAHAARTLLADLAGGRGEPFTPVPWFWSDQYDRKFQLAGRASADCDVEIVAGSEDDRRFTALYGRAGKVVAVLGVNMPAQVAKWRNKLAESAMPWEQALAEARA